MGMAATQVNLLSLTTRGNNVRYDMMRLSMDKSTLAMDMDKVTKEYQESLSAKTFKYTLDGGANYTNLTYASLMYPQGTINQNKLNMLTDAKGRVVLDNKYKEIAEIISPDGSPGNWEAHRWEILSQLTGLSQTDIEDAEKNYKIYSEKYQELIELNQREPDRSKFTKFSTVALVKKLGEDWENKYKNKESIDRNDIPDIMDEVKAGLSRYFLDDDKIALFEQACDTVKETTAAPSTMTELIDYLIGVYKGLGGLCGTNSHGDTVPGWYDIDSNYYSTYVEKYQRWQNAVETTKAEMEAALDQYNSVINAEMKTKIEFYSNLFRAVAEKGWTFDAQVNDPEYLNQMLMNNMFYITDVNTELVGSSGDTYLYKNIYDSQVALNCPNLVQVSDKDKRDEALVRYEDKKRKIERKENKIDTQMKNRETEYAAIKQMMEAYKSIIQKETEKMQVFTG